VKVYRCRICGDPYLGYKAPTNCPFCGAHGRYIVPAEEWIDENNTELSTTSRKNLEEALKIELSNSEFYRCAASRTGNSYLQSMFNGLAKIEAEHATVHAKILKIDDYENLYHSDACNDEDERNIEDSLKRETNAVEKYRLFASQAVEKRVKEVFEALVEVESDHILLDQRAKQYLSVKK